MTSFTDAKGRTWNILVTAPAIERARGVGVDLGRFDRELLEQLDDPVSLVNALFAVCLPQADQRGITDEDFAEGLLGDAYEAGQEALLAATVDFIPRRTAREAARRALKMRTEYQQKALEELDRRLSPERMRQVMDAELETIRKTHGLTP